MPSGGDDAERRQMIGHDALRHPGREPVQRALLDAGEEEGLGLQTVGQQVRR
jgi:hypothetical protein